MIEDLIKKVEAVSTFISKAAELVDDEANKEYFTKNVASIATAKDLVGKNEEKAAILLDAATRWANQLAFLLFRNDKLSEDLAADFRVFATPEETTAEVKKYDAVRDEEIERIKGEQKVVMDANRELDIFRGIIGGMSPEEAEQKMVEYEAAQQPQM